MEKFLNNRLWVGDFARFEALAGGAFNNLNCQQTKLQNISTNYLVTCLSDR